MACPAAEHAPCGGAEAAPLQHACRVSRRGALSVDPLTPQVTLEQPEHCLSAMPAPCEERLDIVEPDSGRHRCSLLSDRPSKRRAHRPEPLRSCAAPLRKSRSCHAAAHSDASPFAGSPSSGDPAWVLATRLIVQFEQQPGSLRSGNDFPIHARQCALERPQQVQARTTASLSDANERPDSANPAQGRHRDDAGSAQRRGGLGSQARQRRKLRQALRRWLR